MPVVVQRPESDVQPWSGASTAAPGCTVRPEHPGPDDWYSTPASGSSTAGWVMLIPPEQPTQPLTGSVWLLGSGGM